MQRPGAKHGNADALSRSPCELKNCVCGQVVFADHSGRVSGDQTSWPSHPVPSRPIPGRPIPCQMGRREQSSVTSAAHDDSMDLESAVATLARSSEEVNQSCEPGPLTGRNHKVGQSSCDVNPTGDPVRVLNAFATPFVSSSDVKKSDRLEPATSSSSDVAAHGVHVNAVTQQDDVRVEDIQPPNIKDIRRLQWSSQSMGCSGRRMN